MELNMNFFKYHMNSYLLMKIHLTEISPVFLLSLPEVLVCLKSTKIKLKRNTQRQN